MTDWRFPEGAGQTPLSAEAAEGLRLSYIMSVDELNAAEQANILKSRVGARTPTLDEILDDLWLRKLHERMFGDVWAWAGKYATTERSLGIDPREIATVMRNLVADAKAWIEARDSADAVATRMHRRLTRIHPFANGNGRHAREVADLLAVALGSTVFTWGTALPTLERRPAYLRALRLADAGDLNPLIEFARG